MKNVPVLILMLLAFPALSCPCFAREPVIGVIAPLNSERVTITQGEKAVATVGERDGIIKGDIGSVDGRQRRRPLHCYRAVRGDGQQLPIERVRGHKR